MFYNLNAYLGILENKFPISYQIPQSKFICPFKMSFKWLGVMFGNLTPNLSNGHNSFYKLLF
jgi:hypothetical protein